MSDRLIPRYKANGAARSNEPWTWDDPDPENVARLRRENALLREENALLLRLLAVYAERMNGGASNGD